MDFYILNMGAFLVAITILTLTPGLDTALVLRNTTRGGTWDGSITSLGICCGLFIHAFLSAVGISAILVQSAQLFMVVKLIGAGYLIYLGVTSLIALYKQKGGAIEVKEAQSHELNAARSFKEGFLSNVLNPKTAVFYLAFLPQFINPEHSAMTQSMLMASIHFVIAMVWQCGLAAMLNVAKNFLANGKAMRWMEGTTGAVLVILGVKLALTR